MDVFIVKSDLISPRLEYQSLYELFVNRLSAHSDQTCMIDCTLGRKWTKLQVLDMSLNLAYYLSHDLNIKKGEVICIASNNSDVHAITMIGMMALGAIYCSFQEECPEFEINGIISKTMPSLIICTSQNYELLNKLAKCNTFVKKILLIDTQSKCQTKCDGLSVEEILQVPRDPNFTLVSESDPNDVVSYVMTSGSTGQPKVILRTNKNQLSLIPTFQHKEGHEMTSNTIQYIPGFCHLMGQMFIIACINAGATMAIVREEIDPNIIIGMINKFKITSAFLAPPRLNFLAKNCQKFSKGYLSSLNRILTGGGPISEASHRIIGDHFDSVIFQNCYGMSEVGWATVVPVSQTKNLINVLTIGKVTPNVEIKVIDEMGHSLPANKKGQICIRSDQITPGYLANDEENSKLFTSDGFLKTGDIGYYDDKHLFYIVDRIKDIIIVGSTNVIPAELEGILMSNPNVQNAAVIAVKDDHFSEVPFAFVTLTDGFTVSEQTLIDYVDSRVNYFKRLRAGLRIIDSFPMTPLNKINKKELKKIFLEKK